jgi:hypothetical protein
VQPRPGDPLVIDDEHSDQREGSGIRNNARTR